MNQEIKVSSVRVISDDKQLGILPIGEALAEAARQGLDLVEVAPVATPPVCRIMDYGKFRYQQSKKVQDARKSQTQIQVKEIRFRPKTEEHDLQVKLRHIRKFLEKNDKVKISMVFRGREMAFTDIGRRIMEKVRDQLAEIATIDQQPRLEGRSMVMVVAPKK